MCSPGSEGQTVLQPADTQKGSKVGADHPGSISSTNSKLLHLAKARFAAPHCHPHLRPMRSWLCTSITVRRCLSHLRRQQHRCGRRLPTPSDHWLGGRRRQGAMQAHHEQRAALGAPQPSN